MALTTFSPGVLYCSSSSCVTPVLSSDAPENTFSDCGTSCPRSSRLRAVTVTVWVDVESSAAAAAAAGAAGAVALWAQAASTGAKAVMAQTRRAARATADAECWVWKACVMATVPSLVGLVVPVHPAALPA